MDKNGILIVLGTLAVSAVGGVAVRQVELDQMAPRNGCHVVCPGDEAICLDGTPEQHQIANDEPVVDYRGDEVGQLNNRAGW